MKKSGLGKGVGALMGEDFSLDKLKTETDIDREYVHELPMNKIDVNKAQPRKYFNQEKIAALAESIKANGLLQPITVQKVGDRYRIVAGERRWRACKYLKAETIPAIIKDLSPRQVCELALVENLQREDLNPIEEASAIRALMEDFELTQEEVAERIGSSRPAIANALRLLKLPKKVCSFIAEGALSAGHGRALASLDDEKRITELAERCIAEDWSVRKIEQELKESGKQPVKKREKKIIPEFERIEENMRLYVGTKVTINGNDKKGKVEIEYFNRDDLEKIISILSPDGEL